MTQKNPESHIKDVELLELMRDHWKNPEGDVDLNEAANIEAYFLSSLRNAFFDFFIS